MKIYACLIVGAILLTEACTAPAEQQKNALSTPILPPAKELPAVPGTNLRFLESGKGRPCLVLGSAIYYPKTFAKSLQNHFKFYFVDLPWFSDSPYDQGLDQFTLAEITNQIEKIRLGLELTDFVLIGHSIHGAVAWEYAHRYPVNISHLVTIGSPNIFASQIFYDAAAALWETAGADRQRSWDATVAAAKPKIESAPADRQMTLNYIANGAMYWYDYQYDATWLWEGVPIQIELVNKLFGEIFSDYRMFGPRENIPVPMLSILGRHDYVVPYTTWKREEGRKNLTVSIFDKSGHTPQLEESERFARVLLSWIDENDY